MQRIAAGNLVFFWDRAGLVVDNRQAAVGMAIDTIGNAGQLDASLPTRTKAEFALTACFGGDGLPTFGQPLIDRLKSPINCTPSARCP